MNGWLPSLAIAGVAAAGAVGGMAVACLPGFHVYSVLGVGFLCMSAAAQGLASDLALVGVVAAVTAWVIVSTIPAILLSAPDESAVFAVLPGQRYLLEGRGLEAIHLRHWGRPEPWSP